MRQGKGREIFKVSSLTGYQDRQLEFKPTEEFWEEPHTPSTWVRRGWCFQIRTLIMCPAWGGGRGSGEWQLRGAGILLGVRKIFWNWHTTLTKLKAIRLYTWKGWIKYYLNSISRKLLRGFPAGSVVKNLPANAGDLGSIPALGR